MNKLLKTFVLLALVVFAPSLWAADVRLTTLNSELPIQETFLVDVIVDSKESINALEGKLTYSVSMFKVKEIRDGGSVVNFWLERPEDSGNGEISFSGITPGGFSGSDKKIFSVVFQSIKLGEAKLDLKDLKVLLNDGEGTAASTVSFGVALKIVATGAALPVKVLEDKEVPEDFTPMLAQDPNLFDGKYFIVFSTEDKISGIDHYAIREGARGEFENAESPYLLKDQTLHKKVFIRAIDKAQNVREVVFDPQKENALYKNKLLFGIIILLVVVVAWVLRKKLWRKYSN